MAIQETHSPQALLRLKGSQQGVEGMQSYGFDWVVRSLKGHAVISHDGQIHGFVALDPFVPEKRLGLVVLFNREDTDEPLVVARKVLLHYLSPEEEPMILAIPSLSGQGIRHAD